MSLKFEEIDNPLALKQLKENELLQYADWLRNFLIEKIAANGGHFAANLGVIELTVALHYVYNAPHDILIWDVGHQSYAHKILTDRKSKFDTLRKKGGISGFPKMEESQYDAFGTAHSSTSISAALGYAKAANLLNLNREHIAIIGDGAMSAGQAFEAINNAGGSNTNLTVIINDNHIGIDPSQGALGEYLDQLDFKTDNLFTDFGFSYFGPIDGHNLNELLTVFNTIKGTAGPKLVHIRTLKGKGYAPAEAEQTKWHSTSEFDKLSGKNLAVKNPNAKFQDVFGQTLLEIAEKNEKVVAVTPAMISGSSLFFMQDRFPERVFDVGIAEQHAVTFSAGLAASGLIPICCIYSTFLQRAYDQLIHDVALQNLPVIFAVDRAGLVGEDGPTHHGVFDIGFLQTIPNISIISPGNQEDLRNALFTAIHHATGPIVIRYPRGHSEKPYVATPFQTIDLENGKCLKKGNSRVAIISYGTMVHRCMKAVETKDVSVYDLGILKPLPTKFLHELFDQYDQLLIVEEVQKLGGIASSIATEVNNQQSKVKLQSMGIADHFSTQGSIEELLAIEGLSNEDILKKIEEMLK
ncbi:MAG TPA: 1-deoxy-D-xylulose-5-phosphate synthase [Bacteroidia bacterium]